MRLITAVLALVIAATVVGMAAQGGTRVLWGQTVVSGVEPVQAIPGASATLTGLSAPYASTQTADATGHFEFVVPKSVTYVNITITATGYQTYSRDFVLSYKKHSDGGIFPLIPE